MRGCCPRTPTSGLKRCATVPMATPSPAPPTTTQSTYTILRLQANTRSTPNLRVTLPTSIVSTGPSTTHSCAPCAALTSFSSGLHLMGSRCQVVHRLLLVLSGLTSIANLGGGLMVSILRELTAHM